MEGSPVVAHIPEYYDYASVLQYLVEIGVRKPNVSDHIHDDPAISLNMFHTDPNTIRWEQRVKLAKRPSTALTSQTRRRREIAKKIVEFRAIKTVEAIRKAIANKAKRHDAMSAAFRRMIAPHLSSPDPGSVTRANASPIGQPRRTDLPTRRLAHPPVRIGRAVAAPA